MREIKFRGKRIDNGEWAYGYYAVHKMMLTGEMDYFIIVNEQRPQSIDPKTVGQYTGLKDINDKEIYEGDITQIFGSSKWNTPVTWDGVSAAFKFPRDQSVEVIGNIYENADLLPKAPESTESA